MDDRKSFIKRYGGHLALLLVALIVFIGLKSLPAGFRLNLAIMSPTEDMVDDVPAGVEFSTVKELAIPQSDSVDLSSIPLRVNYSLSPQLNPKTFVGKQPSQQVITYTVRPNDTPIGIAEQFGIKPETLLGGNAFLSEEASALQPGDTLTILPIDGVLHDVQDGDTLESLTSLYGISSEDIIAYEPNNLEFPYRLYPGTQIMVPGAVREVWFWTAPQAPSRPSTSDSIGSGITAMVQGTGTFIWPVGYRRITQHFWYGHPAIDVGLPEGSPVVAADTGTVTWAGWNVYGYGNLVVVNHGNGYETYYAHLSGVNVYPGQVVNQGQLIGYSGNTGRSSGPHLHIEIRYFNGPLEPLSYLR